VCDKEVSVLLRDAAGDIGGADALLSIVRQQRIDKLARDAAAIVLGEQTLRVRAGDCEAPAGRPHQIVFYGRTSDHIASSMLLHRCQGMQ
jgi:hypothetical protein